VPQVENWTRAELHCAEESAQKTTKVHSFLSIFRVFILKEGNDKVVPVSKYQAIKAYRMQGGKAPCIHQVRRCSSNILGLYLAGKQFESLISYGLP
jgi:hypothetical protein